MLVMIAVGWVVVLPVLVLGGLSLASKVLATRVRRQGAIDVTAFAREVAGLAECEQLARPHSAALAHEPVGSGY